MIAQAMKLSETQSILNKCDETLIELIKDGSISLESTKQVVLNYLLHNGLPNESFHLQKGSKHTKRTLKNLTLVVWET